MHLLIRDLTALTKNKHENRELTDLSQIAKDKSNFDVIAVSSEKACKEYLDKLSFSEFLETDQDRALYDYIRKSFSEQLEPKAQGQPIFGALIERIARTSVILDKYERLLCGLKVNKEELESKSYKGTMYVTMLTEHRRCLESFANLHLAFNAKKKGKVLTTLRESVFQEEDAG